jgi:hypothetical protein
MSEFVTVGCKVINGVVLRTFDEVKGPFETKSFVEKDRVTLDQGSNEVPKEFFSSWLEANSDNDLVRQGFIFHNMEKKK